MRFYATLFLAGMLSFFMGERVFYGDESKRLIFGVVGAAALLSGLLLILKDGKNAESHQKKAYKLPLIYALVAILSLVVYSLGTESMLSSLGLEGESEHRFGVIIACLWPIIWLSGMLPLLALSRMIQASPKHYNNTRAKKQASLWLTAAFALSALIPLNYFANDTNERWDLGYFKTAMPGTATEQLLDALNEPVIAYLFFPSNSDVRQEIRTYFDQIDSPQLETVYIDLLEESVSEDIKSHIKKGRVTDNGKILLVTGKIDKAIKADSKTQDAIKSGEHFVAKGIVAGKCEGVLKVLLMEKEDGFESPTSSVTLEKPGPFELASPAGTVNHISAICDTDNNERIKDGIDLVSESERIQKDANAKLTLALGPIATETKSINIGKEFKDAKKNLKKMDGKFLESLTKLTQGKKTVYVTSGHEEMHWKSRDGLPKTQQIAQFKRMLRSLNYKVEELNIGNGLGSEIPEDANAVLILGAQEAFMTEEIDALNKYREKGGSLLIALEPEGDPLKGLLEPLKLRFDSKSYLVNEDPRYLINRSKRNIATNKYSTHPAITQLSRYGKAAVGFFGLGVLEKEEGSTAKSVIRSPDKTWKDTNGNLKHDSDSEKKKLHDIAVAFSEKIDGEEEQESRVLVISDSTWLSDTWLPQAKTNQIAAWDFLKWLIKDPAAGGTSNEEKDVKIIHSKAGQSWIFYGTVLLLPLFIFVFGWTYVGRRRKKGNTQ